jgi:hypothetical protein
MSDVDVTRCDAMRIMCARGDLNRARPTPVMPSSANLSVNELRLTPVSSSWSAARATRCGTVLVLTSCPTTRPSDGCQPTQVVRCLSVADAYIPAAAALTTAWASATPTPSGRTRPSRRCCESWAKIRSSGGVGRCPRHAAVSAGSPAHPRSPARRTPHRRGRGRSDHADYRVHPPQLVIETLPPLLTRSNVGFRVAIQEHVVPVCA